MGSLNKAINGDQLEVMLLTDSLSFQEDDEGGDGGRILYKASFEEFEESYVNYQTTQWLLFSLLLILAWGVGFIMLLYLPLRRYIVRQEFRSRELYVTSNAIVYKVKRPVFLPCFGVTRREKHMLLPLVTDVVIEQGCLQSAFGIFSMRIEKAGLRRPLSVDDAQIAGVVNPKHFRKVVLMTASSLRKERVTNKITSLAIPIKGEELPTFSSEIRSSRNRGRLYGGSGPASWQMSPVNRIEELNSCEPASGEILLQKLEEVENSVKRVEILIENQQHQTSEGENAT
jgi:hypothetical protein